MFVENCISEFELPNQCAHELRSVKNSCAGL